MDNDKILKTELMKNKNQWFELIKNHQFPLKIKFKIYRKTKRAFDYINIVQQLLDCMVSCEYLIDDNMNYVIPYFDEYCIDKLNPRTIITIL